MLQRSVQLAFRLSASRALRLPPPLRSGRSLLHAGPRAAGGPQQWRGGVGGRGVGGDWGLPEWWPPWPVAALIAANVAVFAAYHLDERARSQNRWLSRFLLSRRALDADPLVLVRSMFAHMSPLHLFFNMYTLHSFGCGAVAVLGPARFAALYLTAGAAGGVCQAYYPAVARELGWPAGEKRWVDAPSLGASGAVAGLIGFLGALAPRSEIVFFVVPMQQRLFLALALGGSVAACYAGSDSSAQLGHAAHIGGAAVGIAAGLLLRRRGARW